MSNAMKVPDLMPIRKWIIWLVLPLFLPLFVGCSAVRLTYNQGPVLAYWWLDGYADFNSEQTPRVKAALADWFSWHRATQLPEYAQALVALQAQSVDKITPAQICSTVQAWQQRGQRAYEHAVPALAEQVRSMTPEQIRQVERRQAKKHDEAVADYLQSVPAERQKANVKRALDRAETAYGTLDREQRLRLSADLAASPFNPNLWLAERQRRNSEILRSLRQWQAERSDANTVQAGLRRLGAEVLQSPRADYKAYADAVMDANCSLAATLHNSASTAQRQHLLAKVNGWEGDVRALIAH